MVQRIDLSRSAHTYKRDKWLLTEHCNECFPPGGDSHAQIHCCSRLYNGFNEAMRSKGDGSQSVDLDAISDDP